MGTTYERIVEIMVTRFGMERADVTPEVAFEDLDMDSLTVVELVLTLQTELGVTIDEESVTPSDTIRVIARRIETLAASAS